MILFARLLVACTLLALAPAAWARSCAVTIGSDDRMRFDTTDIRLPNDCSEVVLTLRHDGTMSAKAMGHNWVLTRAADVQAVAMDGMRASFAEGYVKPGDARVIARTDVIGGGQSTTVRFATSRLRKGGAYAFFCSFPGHFALMRGTLRFG